MRVELPERAAQLKDASSREGDAAAVGRVPAQVKWTPDLSRVARILTAARDRFGLPEDRFHINIASRGNTVAASIPLILDELTQAGRVQEGQKIMFLAFGAGLTWGSSLWQL